MRWTCKAFEQLSLQQLYDIMKLRQEVFVVEQDCAYLDADSLDQDSLHILCYRNKGLIAYSRLVPKGFTYPDHPAISRVITARSARGEGLGNKLITFSIEQIYQHFGLQSIKISAQSYLLSFYNNIGFMSIGDEYLEDGIPHTAMLFEKPDQHP